MTVAVAVDNNSSTAAATAAAVEEELDQLELSTISKAVTASDEDYKRLESILLNTPAADALAAGKDPSSVSVPLKSRFRALFTLKSLKTDRAVDIIAKAFNDPSALLRHELAYVLGQMKNPYAIPKLTTVLKDLQEDSMVRHEAAEALGAISETDALPILEYHASPDTEASRVVRETCELAINKIRHEVKKRELGIQDDASPYTSVDPAPPVSKSATKTTAELADMLMDTSRPLFERYRAMFALRNRGDEESVLALAKGLEDESALFRHEIAYVFGQMQHPSSVPSLIKTLSKTHEEAMVRHECAEALGSIATDDCLPVLQQFVQDNERVVRESCVVGLDMYEFEAGGQFQYAVPLSNASGVKETMAEMKA
ncbi:hypothetical protein HDU76_001408 [Blyttiomyces sp. JEL0837]|nr:hypothetical protein HDU76_001408 [Blyttiomyces sp. JEL0837]